MTEAEAKTKWCPFVRLYGDEWTTRLDYDELKAVAKDVSLSTKCIASGCMSWRWQGVTVNDEIEPSRVHGYCGLAGKPIGA